MEFFYFILSMLTEQHCGSMKTYVQHVKTSGDDLQDNLLVFHLPSPKMYDGNLGIARMKKGAN